MRVDGEILEIPLFEKRFDNLAHVILRGFKGKKFRGFIRLLESTGSRDDGPEEREHPLRQTIEREQRRMSARREVRMVDDLKIRERKAALGCQDENGFTRDPVLNKVEQALHTGGGLTGASLSMQRDTSDNRRLNQRYLFIIQFEGSQDKITWHRSIRNTGYGMQYCPGQ